MKAMLSKRAAAPLAGQADLAAAGQFANLAAAAGIFTEYRTRKAANTIRRHNADLALLAEFLALAGVNVTAQALATEPAAWAGMTWGIVEAWKRWQLQQGYSVASVNQRLSTAKVYAGLAAKAGTLEGQEAALIRSLRGFSRKEGKHIDQGRETARIGHKKAAWVILDKSQAAALKAQPDTPQGRRDSLLMCLLLDHGLRCGEVAGLLVTDFDLKAGELVFYRPKVDLIQRHKLTAATRAAARRYFDQDAPPAGPILRASRKDGRLGQAGMSVQAITARVATLGAALGINRLSAHDCRHYWATRAARSGTQIDRLQQAGGWTSPAMALRYVAAAKVANEGVNLD